MKPAPRPRRGTPTIPKASGPDPAAPTTAPAGPGDGAGAPPAPRTRAKLTVTMDADDLGRARTAWRLACAQPGADYPSLTAWVARLITDATTDIENRLNGGRPLPPTPAGVIPTGRPAGGTR